jgi:hypothetical protein
VLSSWRAGPATQAILEFVAAACGQEGSRAVPVEEQVAGFDNDGTLWCEKPVPIQTDFVLRSFVKMAGADPSLGDRQPWKAAYAWGPRRARRRRLLLVGEDPRRRQADRGRITDEPLSMAEERRYRFW